MNGGEAANLGGRKKGEGGGANGRDSLRGCLAVGAWVEWNQMTLCLDSDAPGIFDFSTREENGKGRGVRASGCEEQVRRWSVRI